MFWSATWILRPRVWMVSKSPTLMVGIHTAPTALLSKTPSSTTPTVRCHFCRSCLYSHSNRLCILQAKQYKRGCSEPRVQWLSWHQCWFPGSVQGRDRHRGESLHLQHFHVQCQRWCSNQGLAWCWDCFSKSVKRRRRSRPCQKRNIRYVLPRE